VPTERIDITPTPEGYANALFAILESGDVESKDWARAQIRDAFKYLGQRHPNNWGPKPHSRLDYLHAAELSTQTAITNMRHLINAQIVSPDGGQMDKDIAAAFADLDAVHKTLVHMAEVAPEGW
jgi:hypothetical protein